MNWIHTEFFLKADQSPLSSIFLLKNSIKCHRTAARNISHLYFGSICALSISAGVQTTKAQCGITYHDISLWSLSGVKYCHIHFTWAVGWMALKTNTHFLGEKN